MTKTGLFLRDSAGTKRPLRCGPELARGAAGAIYKDLDRPGQVVKLYHSTQPLAEECDKIATMITAPPRLEPIRTHRLTCVQIAWPTGTVLDQRDEFRGFVMPEIDFAASRTLDSLLQKRARQAGHLPEHYGFRVHVANNLCSVLTELHKLGHFIIDLKPANLRFYPQTGYLAVLDCDGFSISGRFPATMFSDGYIAPEAKGKPPQALGEQQDLFALAVILFQLLNNGLHPFQGIPASGAAVPDTLQPRIHLQLYCYGAVPHPAQIPARGSIHEYFEDTTRRLFDRAFLGKDRPKSAEWLAHLTALIKGGVLQDCLYNPKEHAHFSKGCGLCALEGRTSQIRYKRPPSPPPRWLWWAAAGLALVFAVWTFRDQAALLVLDTVSKVRILLAESGAHPTLPSVPPDRPSGEPKPFSSAPPKQVSGPVTEVINSTTYRVGDTNVRIWGVRPADDAAFNGEIAHWLRLIGELDCSLADDGKYRCRTARGEDIGRELVSRGRVYQDAAEYLTSEQEAQKSKLGIWNKRAN
jgi:serine/threonine protein kinase